MDKEQRKPKRKRPEEYEGAPAKKRKPAAKKSAPKKTVHKKATRKASGSGMLTNIILAAAIIVFLVSGFMLIKSVLPYFQGGAEYDDIKSLVIEKEEKDDSGEIIFKVDFERLLEINPDTVAWIRFDQPEIISYPVVKGKDNDKYLTATFQANDNKLGSIFMDYRNASDFSDPNTIIYGHNMKIGGEMFSQLVEYKKKDFYEENPYFYIYTVDGMLRTYQIFSAGIVADDLDNYQMVFESDEAYEAYLSRCKKHSAYDTGVEVNADSRIVSLSTCTNVRNDERYLVQGVLIEEKQLSEE